MIYGKARVKVKARKLTKIIKATEPKERDSKLTSINIELETRAIGKPEIRCKQHK